MKRIEFGPGNQSGNLLHIEVPGGIVNIRIGLRDAEGREVTSIEILPEGEDRGGDHEGRVWDLDGHVSSRLVRRAEDEEDVEPPHDENHYRYHTPPPNPRCPNCAYVGFNQPPS